MITHPLTAYLIFFFFLTFPQKSQDTSPDFKSWMSNIEEIVGRSGGNVAPSSDPSSIQRLDELSTKVDRMEAMLVRIEELVTKTPAPTGEDDEYC